MKKKEKLHNDLVEKAITNYFERTELNSNDIENELQDIPFERQKVYHGILSSIKHKRLQIVRRRWISVAASVLFICSVLSLYLIKKQQTRNQFASIERSAPRGKIIRLLLSDGTIVFLNAESKLIYPKKFAADKREVSLEGEGYFQVAHNRTKPFIIHTEQLNTQVLGTSFNINAYRQNNDIRITVITGKVGVYQKDLSKESHTNIIIPDQQLVFNKKAQDIKYNKAINAADYMAWSTGHMIYKNQQLSEIVLEIERHYDVNIELAPNLRNCRITADFNNVSLNTVLTALSTLVEGKFRYNHKGSYFLEGKGS